MGLDLSRVRIVLVDPRIPENIGMAARAMKNCGLHRMALVRPADHLGTAACRPAMEARTLLEAAEVFQDPGAAVAGSGMVVGATRRKGQDRHPLLSPEAWIRTFLPRAAGSDISILFGTEKDGLPRETLDLCDVLITIPASPDFPSFNLAQAVLLVSHGLFLAASEARKRPGAALDLSTSREREELFRHLESVLLRIGFLHRDKPGRVLPTLRRLFGRTSLQKREIRILRGILSQVEWALRRKEDKSRE